MEPKGSDNKAVNNIEKKTWSGIKIKEKYDSSDMNGFDYKTDLGDPGEYPFTRGIHKTMYRGRQWTSREVCGFGGGSETNERLKFQVEHGFSGLSVIPDMATQLQMDADHPLAEPEIGVSGVSLTTLDEMEAMMDGLPIENVNMSFNQEAPPHAVTLAQYILTAQKQGCDLSKIRGTGQNEPLHMRLCGGPLWKKVYPIDLSVKMAVDVIEYTCKNMPLWNSGTCNGYDIQDAGDLTAAQEIAFTFAIAKLYLDECIKRGLDIDSFAPRRAFYMCSHIDIFETAAKLRAARRMWAKILREQYGAKNPKSCMFRFGVHTSGTSLVPQQPFNNIVRVGYEALAAALGGAQSINTCAYDEPIDLPSDFAHMLSARTQQILAHETGVANVVDPLAGSYYVESLTDNIEEEANKILDEIESMGGLLAVMSNGWIEEQMEIRIRERQKSIDTGTFTLVGVNAYTVEEEEHKTTGGGTFIRDPKWRDKVLANLKRMKESRDEKKLKEAIEKLRNMAEEGESVNLMPPIIEAVKAQATLCEVVGTIRLVYGYSYDPFEVISSPF